ncbi:hypothetical protein H5410_062561 [Solanum commersonii]|uniref:Uncharacterized protein n=1 Tax=Solanum commersonii TaxID=4109 RepID=A0A9J5WAP8_SOLCO|nr:hypothetical protein H5410_062561 [Solanum commersonii]
MTNLQKVTIQSPKLLGFDFEVISNFGSVDSSWYTNLHHFVQKFNYSKGLILVIFCHKTNNILIYENPREIVIPPSNDIEIFIEPVLRVESIIRKFMLYSPRIMSILPCTNSKALQVISTVKGCIQKKNCGKECPFNTKWHHNLKEVISYSGTSEEGMAASRWYLWLKSTSIID